MAADGASSTRRGSARATSPGSLLAASAASPTRRDGCPAVAAVDPGPGRHRHAGAVGGVGDPRRLGAAEPRSPTALLDSQRAGRDRRRPVAGVETAQANAGRRRDRRPARRRPGAGRAWSRRCRRATPAATTTRRHHRPVEHGAERADVRRHRAARRPVDLVADRCPATWCSRCATSPGTYYAYTRVHSPTAAPARPRARRGLADPVIGRAPTRSTRLFYVFPLDGAAADPVAWCAAR